MELGDVETNKLAKKIASAAAKKAEDLLVLDMREITTLADYFIICSGSSTPHVRAILNAIGDDLEEEVRPVRKEGTDNNRWIVLDYADVIVHIFHQEEREHYNLEKLWGDAKEVSWQDL
ncbi:iojap-like ribosome-associated protein [Halobacteroides halobius DSM 5150]|uniref:Ribosomal silencing factor RsfS n=1 Tax=Halobacteroides halobius (strain ATCC 35273 / DSM 5150 / MD-1) TaxID=748449 RepID=L0KBB8_HALHC|nr:ribosome silencing factor [Halobacteroides halobius]AGB41825.1 iojap-like ribosome-associated protein [Halobacteroides halobius DSM 5150]